MPEATTLFESNELYMGELRCRPGDDTFGEDAFVTRPIIALPGSPTWIVRHGAERRLANPNHAVIHQAGDVYRRESFDGGGYRCLFVYPKPSLFREIASEFEPDAGDDEGWRLPAGLAPIGPEGFSLSRTAAGHLREQPDAADALRTTDALHRVLRAVVSSALRIAGRPAARRSGTTRAHDDMAEEAKRAMTARYAERLTVEDLARSLHVSPYHLTRVFRRQTGTGLHEYLNQLRVRAAYERIRDGHSDLATLATEVGFSSHSHLTANFGHAFGSPPSSVRQPRTHPRGHPGRVPSRDLTAAGLARG